MRRAVLAMLAALAAASPAAAQIVYPQVQVGGEVIRASVATERASLRLAITPDPELAEAQIAVLDVTFDGERVEQLTADVALPDVPITAGLVEMDPANDMPEVFLEAFTGGAHCCTDLQVLARKASGAWEVVPLGEFDGGGGLVQDVDGDGRYEVATRDQDFLYTFGCYACSAAPLKITAVEAGAASDATFEPRFQDRQRRYLAEIEEGADFAEAGNGFLAGWVAQKIVVGEGEEAWARMLDAYDQADDLGLRFCPNGGVDCPEEEMVARPFPDVLKEFLNEHGYPI